MINKKLVQELQAIIKEEYGRELNFNEASEIANGLVEYFDLLAKVNHRIKNDYENENKQ